MHMGKLLYLALASVAQLVGVLSHKLKGLRFNHLSGCVPGLQGQYLVRADTRRQPISVSLTSCLSLSFSLPLSLKAMKKMPLGQDLKQKEKLFQIMKLSSFHVKM